MLIFFHDGHEDPSFHANLSFRTFAGGESSGSVHAPRRHGEFAGQTPGTGENLLSNLCDGSAVVVPLFEDFFVLVRFSFRTYLSFPIFTCGLRID